ncbi:MAG: rRNA maturation RNase YbeY [Gammaproteobacteria bacterium]|nr:rRNA maturation RNase YbeY [Gammaproteobacteria bacterium]
MIKPKVKLVIDKPATKGHLSRRQRLANIFGRKHLHRNEVPWDYRPHKSLFKNWLTTTLVLLANHPQHQKLLNKRNNFEVYLRIVEEPEMRKIAAKSKHNADLVSVLSFPCDMSDELGLAYIGDIVMCGKHIYHEANELHIDPQIHWGHLFIHSLLHLFGWEHGEKMEELENLIMQECELPALHK